MLLRTIRSKLAHSFAHALRASVDPDPEGTARHEVGHAIGRIFNPYSPGLVDLITIDPLDNLQSFSPFEFGQALKTLGKMRPLKRQYYTDNHEDFWYGKVIEWCSGSAGQAMGTHEEVQLVDDDLTQARHSVLRLLHPLDIEDLKNPAAVEIEHATQIEEVIARGQVDARAIIMGHEKEFWMLVEKLLKEKTLHLPQINEIAKPLVSLA